MRLMKIRWACLALSLALSLGGAGLAQPQRGEDGWAQNALGLSMFQAMEGQAAVSPLSLNLALVMAAEGARGETRAELLRALGVEDVALADYSGQMDSLSGLEQARVRLANGLFLLPEVQVLEEYVRMLEEELDAQLFCTAREEVMEQVNGWVSEQTGGQIPALLTQPPDPAVRLMLLNALSLEADFARPFLAEDTKERPFTLADGSQVQVNTMAREGQELYAEDELAQWVRLPYQEERLSLTVILPREGQMAAVLDRLASQPGDYLSEEKTAPTGLALALPKLEMEASASLIPLLQQAGVIEAFTQQADFTGIDASNELFVSEMKQQVKLKVDERGTRAAAATQITMSAKGMPSLTQMRVDRPYLLVVADETTQTVLFAARVENPAA